MAGIIAALVFSGASEGIDKIKSKRAERKARRGRQPSDDEKLKSTATASTVQSSSSTGDDVEDGIRGLRFAESKAREASEERRRTLEGDDANQLDLHPALRDPESSPRISRVEVEALMAPPPPYVEDPPSYEEHVAAERAQVESSPTSSSPSSPTSRPSGDM